MNALGMIETNSIPAGIEAGDAMMKAADVRLVTAQAVCAGKYIVIVARDVAAVKAAVGAAKDAEEVKGMAAGTAVIPSPHPDILQAIF